MDTAIEVNNLSVSYHSCLALKNINFSINKGNLVGIVGPNGAGKSTLIKAILGLIKKDYGTIKIFNKDVKNVRKRLAYVPQRNDIDWDFPITVLDTVLIGTYPKLGIWRRPRRAEKEWAYKCLQQVGMDNCSHKQIGELSGGQQQRIFLARALAQQADMFFLDEPFVGVDIASEEMIIRILKQLRDDGKTIFVVHHDLTTVTKYFDQLILLNKQLIKYGPVEDVFTKKFITKAYNAEYSIMKEVGVT